MLASPKNAYFLSLPPPPQLDICNARNKSQLQPCMCPQLVHLPQSGT
jgi:hypothetical protein